ncbi:MAG: transcriptional repressor [Clostridiales bacterium]|nr:transcriptional repressor [Clostridiales bacterium]
MSRNTIQQDIICSTVKSMSTHPSPDEVFEALHKEYPSIGRATVYRVLNKLANKGEIKKVNLPHTADRFDFRTDDHIHIHCKKCNRVFDVDFHAIEGLIDYLDKVLTLNNPLKINGFEITGANFSFEGICKDCRHNKQDTV